MSCSCWCVRPSHFYPWHKRQKNKIKIKITDKSYVFWSVLTTLPSSVCFDLLKQPRRSTTNATENFLTTVAWYNLPFLKRKIVTIGVWSIEKKRLRGRNRISYLINLWQLYKIHRQLLLERRTLEWRHKQQLTWLLVKLWKIYLIREFCFFL